MIRSMTGIGKGTVKGPHGKITAEIKSLNHRNLSITCNPFNGLFFLDEKMKKIFEGKVYRGKIFIRITREAGDKQKKFHKVLVNEDIARDYLKKIKKIQKNLGVKGEIKVRELIAFPGVIESSVAEKEEHIWPYIRKALEEALKKLVEYRQKEGRQLARDLTRRARSIKESMRKIKKNEKESVSEYREKLLKSIQKFAAHIEPDKSRMESEVALFAKNYDISEEITRLEGHLAAYKDALTKSKADVGKKLDFIAQEMQREANTIGAKTNDFRISRSVIEVKTEVEKMREQIKNIE